MISLIIPTYRDIWYNETIESALNQKNVDFELIIIRSGKDIKYPESEKIRYFYKPEMNGVQKGNFGIQQAKGEIITVLHDDDKFTNNESLYNRYKYFELLKNNGLEFIYSGWRSMRMDGSIGDNKFSDPVSLIKLINKEYIHCVTMMWKKSIHEKIGYFDEDIPAYCDYLFKIRCLMECSCLMIPDNTIDYREHSEQHSVKIRTNGEAEKESKLMREKLKLLYGRLF